MTWRRRRIPLIAGATVISGLLMAASAVAAVSHAGSASRTTTPAAHPVTSHGVTVTAAATAARVVAGTVTTLSATVTSTTRRGVVLDLEVYDAAGHRVLQRSWPASLTAGRAITRSTSWAVPRKAGVYRVAVGTFGGAWTPLLVWSNRAADVSVVAGPASTTSTTSTTSAPTGTGASAPTHFGTLSPDAAPPSQEQCAAWVRALPVPTENKAVNRTANATVGAPLPGATGTQARITGAFTGTTEQILRWAACKWGVDEDIVKAQAAVESWWHMDNKGDWGTDATRCAPGHGLGVDGTAGQCPESWGLLQIRYPYNTSAFPHAITSTAFNADYAYAQFRACYLGEWTWLNTVEHTGTYAAGDAWGCLGVWFSGRWHDAGAEGYITKVKSYLAERIWTTATFQQP
ncbi:MAG TPA: hypothetical protein VI248_22965 [Kineosporiaceae bacterium]